MQRTRSVAAPAPTSFTRVDRRSLLVAAGAITLSAGVGHAAGQGAASAAAAHGRAPGVLPTGARALSRQAPAAPPAPYTRGTTLGAVATPLGRFGYRRLGDGPAWTRRVRSDLAVPAKGREDRRTALAAFVHFTDLHLVDVQHPLRYEYLRASTASAWRPQEALSVAGAAALVERVNALRGGPVTAAPLSFVMTTGDNTDNNARSELDWFLTVMSGGRIHPNTGDPHHYEGVQNSGLPLYWQPEAALRDADKRLGFPHVEGFLDAAIRTVHSPGLNLPWYSTVGNHDALPGGCWAPGDGWAREIATGGRKLMELPAATGAALWREVRKGRDPKGTLFREMLRTQSRHLRHVTPDERRAPFTPDEYVRAHLDPAYTGPGPVGHGYTRANLADGSRHYAFRIADDVLGISLDTTDAGGHYEGSLGTAQLRWLERTLRDAEEPYVIVFSHHTSRTMGNTRPDPAHSAEARHGGDEVVALLGRHPKVVAWINGHSHKNAITPHGGFWEISTASHIDFPQLARVIELVDNKDGTLSLFTTLVESSAPHRTDTADLSQTGLAALYRELSLNAPGARQDLGGTSADRNTELVLRRGR
ncbi:TIGR03767 family metallophosphoesterase [Streptomyces tsukubensis]|uniref:Metallophosphoesterase n=1 Tax=Streptomyces tsukubensis TaxID=83656 RepID=A0A1V4ABL5_9ACTN|nr:TIGR03767 family metallophosphoesterase [Streptomyces tsukubensis]OON80771.1 metallophosphoesterase [Streptomyces tsukubensis]QFR93588.1 TIGR03767 family metallophosphoesterase [Streptomyces tsukubensis]